MIEIVEGVVGGGKTLYAVRQSLERIAQGGRVFTNVDMVVPEVRRYLLAKYGVHYRTGQITRLPEAEGVSNWWQVVGWGDLSAPVLCVLDEAQMFWNARDYRKTGTEQKDMLSFLTQSRKAGVDVTIISQDANNVDSQFRRLAQQIVLCRNMGHVRLPYIGIKLKGFIHYSFHDTKAGNRFKFEWWRMDKRVFRCYKTEAFLDSLMQDMAETRERLKNHSLRRTDFLRKLVAQLEIGDRVERYLAKRLRPIVAARLRAARAKRIIHREQHETNTITSVRRRGYQLRRVQTLRNLQRRKLRTGNRRKNLRRRIGNRGIGRRTSAGSV